jgi:ATP-dependent helicase/nuclease subunit A
MRQRVAGQLARRTDPLAAAWRRNLTQARISTIHGFAASLLRTWPVEAGVDPSFSVLADEFRRTQMRQAACQDALRAGLDRQSEPVAELLGALGYSRVLDMLATLLDERWRWSAREYADYEKTLQTWRQQREKIAQEAWQDPKVQAAGKELALRIKVEAGDRLADHLLMQRKIISALLYDPAARTPDTFSQLATAGNLGSAKAWESKEQMMDVRASLRRLVALLGDLAPLHGPLNERDTQSAKLLATLTGIAAAAIGRYRAAKRRAGLLDFVDLQSAALHLLRRHEMVRLRVAEGITQLLIDEFQDTDSLQRELLYLAVDCQGPKPPPGRIFFVGDAKQSIYRFRGAEVEVFEQARQAIDPAGRQNLDLNFRTHRGGVALVNRIFRPLMGDAYEPLVAHRRELPELPAAEVVLADCPGGNAYTRYRAGARATADRIAWMLADGERHIWDEKQNQWRPVRPGDVAILLPRLQNTGPFEDALDEHGIPYFVIAGAGLFNQQEVHDLISALRAIDNPLDDIALMGFLRGQMVGLDDNTLAHVALGVSPPYRLNLCDPQAPGRLPVSLAERLALPAAGRLAWAMSLLEHLAAAKDACGPEELIRRLLELTSYEGARWATSAACWRMPPALSPPARRCGSSSNSWPA